MQVEDVFKQGPLPTQTLTIAQARGRSTGNVIPFPPKPLMLIVPSVQGDYPILLFLHGYVLVNYFYSQLLQHIASHGYITIAPQMYTTAGADTTGEIADAVAITEWLRAGLCQHLPEKVQPDFQKLAIAGHSRGGKVAFGAALGRTPVLPSSPYAALLGIDPVDGMGAGKQTPPPILTYKEHSFTGNIPTLVIGSGLGPVKRNPLFPPCAPAGVNHVDFFRECCAPAYHFVAVEYGHVDFLDDETSGVRGKSSYCLCKNGVAREPMRRFSGGVMVAFLNAWLRNKAEVLDELVANPSLAPVKVEAPDLIVV
ncbi:hypothetical protein SUGI_1148430 [Cryptomeria japonica]|nr:hypothetical protein SUGI_1148430 [Cryptomeria japonica]